MTTIRRIPWLLVLSLLLLGGCSLSNKTTVDTLDDNFLKGSSNPNTLGLLQLDWITIQPMKDRDKAFMAFGLLGGLAAVAMNSSEDADNYDIETVSLALYQKDLPHLKQRLGEQIMFQFFVSDELAKIEPVQFSREVRSKRAWGAGAPADEKVQSYFKEANNDYAL